MNTLARSILHKAVLDMLERFTSRDMRGKPEWLPIKRKWLRLRATVFLTRPSVMLTFWSQFAGIQETTITRIAERIHVGDATEEEIGRVLSFLRPLAHLNGGTMFASGGGEAEEEAAAEPEAAGF